MYQNEKELCFSCILFDLDGTVLDTVSDCTSAINKTMEVFSLPQRSEKQVQSYLNNGARMLIKRALPENLREDEIFVDKVLETYIEFYKEDCIKASVIYDGVYDCLKKLKEKGAKLGIVTNKPDLQTQIIVPHYFGELFDYMQGNSETVPVKPDKKRVEMALSALGKEKNETIFVGDSWVDTETARNAGIPCIGVSWGFSGKEGFVGHMPDIIVDKAKEIVDIAVYGL